MLIDKLPTMEEPDLSPGISVEHSYCRSSDTPAIDEVARQATQSVFAPSFQHDHGFYFNKTGAEDRAKKFLFPKREIVREMEILYEFLTKGKLPHSCLFSHLTGIHFTLVCGIQELMWRISRT